MSVPQGMPKSDGHADMPAVIPFPARRECARDALHSRAQAGPCSPQAAMREPDASAPRTRGAPVADQQRHFPHQACSSHPGYAGRPAVCRRPTPPGQRPGHPLLAHGDVPRSVGPMRFLVAFYPGGGVSWCKPTTV
jgi:hypothetical protein